MIKDELDLINIVVVDWQLERAKKISLCFLSSRTAIYIFNTERKELFKRQDKEGNIVYEAINNTSLPLSFLIECVHGDKADLEKWRRLWNDEKTILLRFTGGKPEKTSDWIQKSLNIEAPAAFLTKEEGQDIINYFESNKISDIPSILNPHTHIYLSILSILSQGYLIAHYKENAPTVTSPDHSSFHQALQKMNFSLLSDRSPMSIDYLSWWDLVSNKNEEIKKEWGSDPCRGNDWKLIEKLLIAISNKHRISVDIVSDAYLAISRWT
jgi:hypothetical protein